MLGAESGDSRVDDGRRIAAVRVDHGERRHRHAELGESVPHQGLVLGVLQGVGAGVHGVPLGGEGADVLAGDVLVIEGDDVTAAGEGPQRARSVCSPIITSGVTSAAQSSAETDSTRRVWPSAMPAWCVIRASWPPPTIPTRGMLVRESTGPKRNRPRW